MSEIVAAMSEMVVTLAVIWGLAIAALIWAEFF